MRLWERLTKSFEIPRVCTPKSVDGLVVVTDDKYVFVFRDDSLCNVKLDGIGILKLIDKEGIIPFLHAP